MDSSISIKGKTFPPEPTSHRSTDLARLQCGCNGKKQFTFISKDNFLRVRHRLIGVRDAFMLFEVGSLPYKQSICLNNFDENFLIVINSVALVSCFRRKQGPSENDFKLKLTRRKPEKKPAATKKMLKMYTNIKGN